MNLPDPWRYPRQDTASHFASLLADAPRRPLAVFGPRQVGKTHFLTHDLGAEGAARGWEPLYVDLWGQADPLGATNTVLATALRRLALTTGRQNITALGAFGASVGLTAPAPLETLADPAATLSSRFAELLRLQPAKPVLLMLDEAQTLVKAGAGDMAMKAIRALFNSHAGRLLLVLTGSSKAQLLSLVGDHSKTAFKLAAQFDFPLLGAGFVAHVAQRYRDIAQRDVALVDLDWAFSQLQQRPGEMIDFVRFMITEVTGMDVHKALAAFKARHQTDTAFEEQFLACSPLQQALLMEVLTRQKLFAQNTREKLATRLGQVGAMAPASIYNALQQLQAKGLLIKASQRGSYAFEDDTMRAWVEKHAAMLTPAFL